MRTEWIAVMGRRVKICTGQRSQTINVCEQQDPCDGVYAYRYVLSDENRFVTGFDLEAEGFLDIEQMAHYLIVECCAVDGSDYVCRRTRPGWEYLMPDLNWGQSVTPAINDVVKSLMVEFQDRPFRHRCEHSLHCELYERLGAIEGIAAGAVNIIGSRNTALVHKEWPESGVREAKDGRGNYDIAVLSPRDEAVEEDRFLRGYVKPYFAFELGLDYGCDHLKNDILKLRAHSIPETYAIHFARPKAADQERVEEFIERLEVPRAVLR